MRLLAPTAPAKPRIFITAAMMFASNILPRMLNWCTQAAGHRRPRGIIATWRNRPWPSLPASLWTFCLGVSCSKFSVSDAVPAGTVCQHSIHELHASRLPRGTSCNGREPARGAGDHRMAGNLHWTADLRLRRNRCLTEVRRLPKRRRPLPLQHRAVRRSSEVVVAMPY